jgi:circadian clock protein KaiC
MKNGTAPGNGAHRSVRQSRPSGVLRMPTGIPGFDQLLDGGLPRERITLLAGGPGSGKTLFALQTLVNGVRTWNERAIFVAFEERAAQVIADSSSLGWKLETLRERELFLLDAHLPESVVLGGDFDLGGLLSALEAKVSQTGAKRIVFDGIDMLLGILDNPLAERREIFRLAEWIRRRRLTGIVTCKTDADGSVPRPHDAHLPYLADCVVTLQQQASATALVRRLRVTKCRGIAHSGNDVPFTIAASGLQVASYPIVAPATHAATAKVSTGVPRLDAMFGGGYFRGSSILISGSPGTAKSTLAASFAESAASRGEQTLYVSLDETGAEITRNMLSVGINLAPHLRSGRLVIASLRKGDRSAEEHIAWISNAIVANKTRCLVIDPTSALSVANSVTIAEDAVAQLIGVAKSLGITLLMTSLVVDPNSEASLSGVSTVSDTWIHVSYLVLAGERNRAFTIIKARGMHHSNQVRELILSGKGVELTDVYLAGGEVLMGTMRWQKELSELSDRADAARKLAHSQEEAELAVAEARARLASLDLELAAREAALQTLKGEQVNVEQRLVSRQTEMRRLRAGEPAAAKNGRRRGAAGEVSR